MSLKLDDEATELVRRLGRKIVDLCKAQGLSTVVHHYQLYAINHDAIYFSAHPLDTYLVTPPDKQPEEAQP